MNTPILEEYDLIVLGSGEGGKYLAWTCAREGRRVAVVERQHLGGSCPNVACLPSKNIIHSAKIAALLRRRAEFGVVCGDFTIDMAAVRDRKRGMVNELMELHRRKFVESGVAVIFGSGHFTAPRTVEAQLSDGSRRHLRGTHVVIGTGSRAVLDPIPGLGAAHPLTHIEALELGEVPDHLLVIGAGYVGLELSQAMRRFGSRVTVIDRNSALLHHEDDEVSGELAELFRDEGVGLVLGARVKQVSGVSGDAVTIVVEQNGRERKFEGTHLLVAAGRVPNTDGLAPERAGVELTSSGHIKVNERLETTATGVWAVGDVTGNPQFTHIGFDDFRVVHENMNGGNRTTSGRLVPFCLYTDPELARVGLNEKQAAHLGVSFRVFRVPMTAVMRTYPLSEKRGFLKALVGDDDRILGFTAFGVHAGEVMSAVQLAMIAGLPYTAIRDAILTHPTATEGLIPLFSSTPAASRLPASTTAGGRRDA